MVGRHAVEMHAVCLRDGLLHDNYLAAGIGLPGAGLNFGSRRLHELRRVNWEVGAALDWLGNGPLPLRRNSRITRLAPHNQESRLLRFSLVDLLRCHSRRLGRAILGGDDFRTAGRLVKQRVAPCRIDCVGFEQVVR